MKDQEYKLKQTTLIKGIVLFVCLCCEYNTDSKLIVLINKQDKTAYLYPLINASPAEIDESPMSILNVLVFPAPFTPSKPKH